MATRGNGKFNVYVIPMGGGYHPEYGFTKLRDAVRYAHYRCWEEKSRRGVRYCYIGRDLRCGIGTTVAYVRPTDWGGGNRTLFSFQPTDHYAWDVAPDGVAIFDITDKFDHAATYAGDGI